MSTYRATVQGNCQGQIIDNVLHFATGNAIGQATVAEAIDVATRVNASWVTNILPQLSGLYTFTGTDTQAIFDPNIGAFVGSSGAGAQAGGLVPVFAVAKVKMSSGFRGRANQGRTGLSPLVSSQIVGNLLTTTAQAALNTAFTAFRTTLAGLATPVVMQVVSTVVNGAPRPTPITVAVQSTSVPIDLGSRVSRKNR